jgi:hypothetical protein
MTARVRLIAVWKRCLKSELGRGLEKLRTIALDMVAELDSGTLVQADQLPEERSPFHEREPAQILAIEVQEIESKERIRWGAV